MENIKIGTRKIGKGMPCFIIAEAGVNHNGSLETAKRLVEKAVEAGVDSVKFQAFKSEDLVTESAEKALYQSENVGKESSHLKMLKKYELSLEEFKELREYCDKKGILFLTTPHTGGKVLDFVDKIVPAFKIGSGDLTNLPFLESIALKGKPIIVGTGMSSMEEVKQALGVIYATGNKKVVALHCTTSYPCQFEDVNLNAMKAMQKELGCLVGYSDHTLGITVPIMAAALGAAVIEKLFTLDKAMDGPDHKASLDPQKLKEMVKGIRNAEKALGKSEKKPVESEMEIMKAVRKSIVAATGIPRGTTVTKGLVCIKRPGTGLGPAELKKVLGRKAGRNIKKDELIGLGDLV